MPAAAAVRLQPRLKLAVERPHQYAAGTTALLRIGRYVTSPVSSEAAKHGVAVGVPKDDAFLEDQNSRHSRVRRTVISIERELIDRMASLTPEVRGFFLTGSPHRVRVFERIVTNIYLPSTACRAVMQIRHLLVRNFRGITSLDWSPRTSFACLIGAGDSGKSTILDAVEAALNSRWFSFNESDFYAGDTSNPISIEVTVGELSAELKKDGKFGLYIRGWTSEGRLRDEPESTDEPVLTIRLTVDASLEPSWEVICDRLLDTRQISNRDRAKFGLVRLSGDDARQLAWGQGSILARLTGDNKEASLRLAEAYRSAKESARLHEIPSLVQAAGLAQGFAKGMGAYISDNYVPGLELGRAGLSAGAIALHDGAVPLRLAGLGTRRLASLAIQKSAIKEGAIVLIDEIEHGLEPHRIVGSVAQLKSDQAAMKLLGEPIGQVLLTTHSEAALGECGVESVNVVQTDRITRVAGVMSPISPDAIRPLVRFNGKALFARRILVCEGMTEVGILMGLRDVWIERKGKPIEQLSVALADGNGSQATEMALGLAELGYQVAIFMDSDVPLTRDSVDQLAEAQVQIIEYGVGTLLNTEQAIFTPASDTHIQELIQIARSNHGEDSINESLIAKLPGLNHLSVQGAVSGWSAATQLPAPQIRLIVAEVAKRKKWFKEQRYGREIAPVVWKIICHDHHSPLTGVFLALETWIYA